MSLAFAKYTHTLLLGPYTQVGDWTEQLFRLCLEDPRMPLWITAAQPSVLEQTVYYDNGKRLTVIVLRLPFVAIFILS